MKFNELQARITTWRNNKLEGVTLESTLHHLAEEVEDLIEDPYNPLSIADVFILLMGVCDEVGYSMEDIAVAIESKCNINEARTWLKDENGIFRHEIEETKF